MYSIFVKLLIKSFDIIKKEPLILMPFILFQMSIVFIEQLISPSQGSIINDHFLVFSFIDWLIPTLVIQPLVILIALNVIQKKKHHIVDLINRYILGILPLFLVSLLSKPLYIIGMVQFVSKLTIGQSVNMDALSPNELFMSTGLIFSGLIMGFITIFFASCFFSNMNKNTQVSGHFKYAVSSLYEFKWVVVSLVLYYLILNFMIQGIVVGGINTIVQKNIGIIFISILSGIERTFFQVFILRLFLYVKPLINLNYN